MKRRIIFIAFIFTLTTVLSLSACTNTGETSPAPDEEILVEPTSAPIEEVSEDKTETDQSLSPDPDEILSTVLIDYRKVFEETKSDLLANNGQHIGTDHDQRAASGDGIQFMAQEGENPFMPLTWRLNEFDGVNGNNQAFYMKFKPSQKDFGFMLSADGNAGLTINEQGHPQVFVMNHDFSEALENDFAVEPDNWYHVLVAMGSDGLMQGTLWNDSDPQNAAYLNLHIGQSFGDPAYVDQSWQVHVGFQGEATFTIEKYAYYTFENFVMPDRVLEMDDSQQNDENLQEPQSRDDVLYSMLMMPQELWGEGSNGFSENQGGEFGGGAAEKKFNENEGRLEMISDNNASCVPFNTRLRDCGQENRPQQAVMVRFQAEKGTDFRFSFEAMSEISISFREDGPYFTDVASFFEMPFNDFVPNQFELKPESIYYFFFSVDENAMMHVFVWEEGMIENQAYLEYDLYKGADDVYDSNWQMFIGFGPNSQLNIYEYWVYTFDEFIEDSPFLLSFEN